MQVIQREIEDLKAVATGPTLTGELRLGVTPTLLCGIFPDAIARFSEAYPRIDIRVARHNSSELYGKLLDGQIDAALTSHPSFDLPKTFEWKLLRREPFVVLTPKSMPQRRPRQILTQEPFIRLDSRVYAGQAIDNYLRKNGIYPKDRFEIDGLEAIAIMVDRGLGVTVLPDWAPPWPDDLKLRKIGFSDQSFARRIGLLWMRSSLRINLIHAFFDETLRSLKPARRPD